MNYGQGYEQCKLCGREMEMEDESFSYEYGSEKGIKKQFVYYCGNCDLEEDYDNSEIELEDSLWYDNTEVNLFNTEYGVIVTVDDDVVDEVLDLEASSISSVIKNVLTNLGIEIDE